MAPWKRTMSTALSWQRPTGDERHGENSHVWCDVSESGRMVCQPAKTFLGQPSANIHTNTIAVCGYHMQTPMHGCYLRCGLRSIKHPNSLSLTNPFDSSTSTSVILTLMAGPASRPIYVKWTGSQPGPYKHRLREGRGS